MPNPDPAAANATNNCVAACPQGNGTAADNLNYKNCVDGCIGKYYFTSSGTPEATAGSGSGSGGGVVTTTDSHGATVTTTTFAAAGTGGASGSGSGRGSGSPAGSAAPSQSATGKNGGETLRAGAAVGLVGVFAALMAI